MILGNNESTNAFSSNALPEDNFKVIAGSKMFQVLSSKIYKNKIRAVVRELVCNCVDAHVLNGNKDKFIVKAPNALKPTFEVRDYGPGLSNSDMVELYTTYFASSKANRNDQIGSFGLGSKSPFSYTDTFTTISYFEGVASVFVATMINGEPKLALSHQEPMSDNVKSGLHVIIPVRTDDFSTFITEIEYVMRPFNPETYQVTGHSDIDIKSYPEFKSYLIDSGQYDTPNGLWALYGSILYPIGSVAGVHEVSGWARSITGRAIIFKFAPGTLDIQPSREELSLDETTIKNVVSTVKRINNELISDKIEQFSKLSNIRDCFRFLNNLGSTCSNSLLSSLVKESVECVVNPAYVRQEYSKHSTRNSKYAEELRTTYCRELSNWNNKISMRRQLLIAPKSESQHIRVSETTIGHLFPLKRTEHSVFINDSKHADAIMKQLYASKLLNSTTMILNSAYGEIEIERQKKVISEIVCGESVTYYKSSDYLEEFLKARKADRIAAPKRAYVSKPTAPNAYRYTLKDGVWTSQLQYLSSEELDNLDTFVVPTNFNDVTLFCKDAPYVGGANISTIKSFVKSLFDTFEFTELRPASTRRVLTTGKSECLTEYLIKEVKRRWESVGELAIGTDNIFVNENALQLEDPSVLVANYTKERHALQEAIELFDKIRVNLPSEPDLVNTLRNSISDSIESANKIASSYRKAFKTSCPMIYEVLNSRYVNKDVIKDADRYLRLLTK